MIRAYLGCLLLVLGGCAPLPPSPSLSAPSLMPAPLPAPPPAEPPSRPDDLWERLRRGFALPHHAHPQSLRYAKDYARHQRALKGILERGAPFLYLIAEAVEKRHMPLEIALLPAVESAFDPSALSKKGAAGMWQFMPTTASRYGLSRDTWSDSRLDVMASTEAALDHLSYLHERFGDWLLAIAAYNCGAGAIARALEFNRRHHKAVDVVSLPLPRETRHYVPKLLGLAMVIQDPEAFGVTLPPLPNEPALQAVEIEGPLALTQVAEMSGLPFETVARLNPAYRYGITPPQGSRYLLLPKGKAPRFKVALASLPKEERVHFRRHRIRRGETLIAIARRHRVPLPMLKYFNRLQGHLIRAGDELIIPLKGPEKAPSLRYIVRRGDSLWGIARRFKVNITLIRQQNGLSDDRLYPGQSLIIRTRES